MKNWFQKMGRKLTQWMQGRYGYDELSRFLSVVALVLVIVGIFVPYVSFLAWVLLVLSLLRSYSRNIARRERERATYLQLTSRLRRFVNRQKNRWRDRKTHRYYKCKGCKTYLRLPKGKGKIKITCPNCQTTMLKKT